jgi:phosphopantothenoylcysteine decarboxylase/phosphopantothenate--cysteine ligase
MSVKNKKILVGASAGISIYKTCLLVRLFMKQGAQVKVVMTESAAKLISPVVFHSLTQSPVCVSMFEPELGLEHINLAKWADAFVLAPATANTIAKIAQGIADNLLTTIILALPEKTPLIVAPAMNDNMWKNVFVKENVAKLKKRRNCYIVGPKTGVLADGKEGEGRMAEPEEIFKVAKKNI